MLPETNELAFPASSFREGGKNKRGVPRWREEKGKTAREDTQGYLGAGKIFFTIWRDVAGQKEERGGRAACEKRGGLKFRKKEK